MGFSLPTHCSALFVFRFPYSAKSGTTALRIYSYLEKYFRSRLGSIIVHCLGTGKHYFKPSPGIFWNEDTLYLTSPAPSLSLQVPFGLLFELFQRYVDKPWHSRMIVDAKRWIVTAVRSFQRTGVCGSTDMTFAVVPYRNPLIPAPPAMS